jgi:cell division control protein 6
MSIEDNEITDFSEIFEDHKSKIFNDPSVLSPDYIPNKLIGRTKEITDLAKIFKPIDYRGYPFNAFIFGKTGSGKTVVTKFLLQKLMERLEVKKELMDHPLIWVYIPCKSNCTTNAVLYDIIKQVDPDTKIAKKGWALTYYYDELWKVIRENNVSLVVVLDEIDRLKDDELLYNLSRAGEMQKLPERHFISIIGISNDLEYGKELDSRVISSMSPKDHFFDPYNAEQIALILNERVKIAFIDDAVPEETIKLISAYAAQDHGDARKAIKHLKVAAAYAEDNGYSQVLPEHVETTLESVDVDRVLEIVPNFPLHEKIVLLAILKLTNYGNPATNSQAVTSVYTRMCIDIGKKPLHRTTIASKFGDFKMLGLIKTSSMRKGKGGGWKDIRLSVSSGKAVEEVLYQDYLLDQLRDFKLSVFKEYFD